MVLLYLESFGNPRQFAGLARRHRHAQADRRREERASAGGQRAAGVAHGRARSPPPTSPWMRCSGRAGVIRTDTLGEMFDVATLLANQPPPEGNRVGIVTNAGGLGILCADACEANGLNVPSLAQATRGRAARVPPGRGIIVRTPST